MTFRPLRALGFMSGTSMDGVDVALVETDGEQQFRPIAATTRPYPPELRARLAALVARRGDDAAESAAVEVWLTACHIEAAKALLDGLPACERRLDLVGFHGHTVDHRPRAGVTRQIGDATRLAHALGVPVVHDFRSEDVRQGGEGAPLVPVFHALLARGLERPLAFLNIGGIANVTWVGPGDRLLAFDTGPGNALLDDWSLRTTGRPFDENGRLAASGRVDKSRLARLLAHPFFLRPPPKSLDRNDFPLSAVEGLDPADGAATLAALTIEAVVRAIPFLPQPPCRWLVCGGGRRNRTLVAGLASRLEVPVAPVEAIGADGDALEAQAFAVLAVRVLRGLPTSFPDTTGVAAPCCGGRIALPNRPAGDRPLLSG
ncbi:Anhydro-N-acetylmuramic acid kinase [bacterium HR40]|nr:Anhydro-N-acetylmuramic acid kinase [bacterium HR40]